MSRLFPASARPLLPSSFDPARVPLGLATGLDQAAVFDGTFALAFDTGSTSDTLFASTTIYCRWRADALAGTQVVHSHGSADARLYFTADGSLHVGNSTDTGFDIVAGRIYETEIDIDAGGRAVALRVDGVEEWTGTALASTNGESEFSIGGRINSGSWGVFFDGKIFEVYVANYLRWRGAPVSGGLANILPTSFADTWEERIDLPDASYGTEATKGMTGIGIALAQSGQWWVTNYGDELHDPADPDEPSLALLSSDFAAVLAEIDMVTATGDSNFGLQGIAYDITDGTLWVCGNNDKIYHLATDGTLLGTLAYTDANGIAYDSRRDRLWVLKEGDNSQFQRIQKDGTVELTVGTSTTGNDHLTYDAANDILWISSGTNGVSAVIQPYYCAGRVTGSTVALDATETTSIEGIAFDADRDLWVMSNGYYHATAARNNVQRYTLTPTIPARDAATVS